MTDVPFNTCVKMAEDAIGKGFLIYQKWTCSNCGSRQTMEQANAMFMQGKCEECSNITDIKQCGFMALIGVSPSGKETQTNS